jgi:hypothetical protein
LAAGDLEVDLQLAFGEFHDASCGFGARRVQRMQTVLAPMNWVIDLRRRHSPVQLRCAL